MPRKKKKSHSAFGLDAAATTIPTTTASDPSVGKGTMPAAALSSSSALPDVIAIVDVLQVNARAVEKEHTQLLQVTTNTCQLTADDGHCLDVANNDEVLVINPNTVKAAICKVHIVSHAIKSPRQLIATKNAATAMPLRNGTAALSPSSLYQHVALGLAATTTATNGASCSANEMSSPTRKEQAAESITSPRGTPSSKGFSFKDVAADNTPLSVSTTTPSSTLARPQLDSGKKKGSSTTIWIVALDSDLGDKLRRIMMMGSVVHRLRVQCCPPPNDAEKCARVLQLLVMAQCQGKYWQVGQSIKVSFRGLPLHTDIVSLDDGDGSDCLPDHMAKLAIQNEIDDAFAVDQSTPSLDADLADEVSRFVRQHGNVIRLGMCTQNTVIEIEGLRTTSPNENVATAKERVVGLDHVVQRIRKLLSMGRTRQGRCRGVLLHGSSGTGKTCLLRQMAQEMQGEYNVETVSCLALQLQTRIVGEAERQLSSYFMAAASPGDETAGRRPRLLILDDIHLIGAKRSNQGWGTEQLTSTLLALMDGVESAENSNPVTILAATNDPTILDPALRRPGRLDTEVEVPIPDSIAARAEILRYHVNRLGPDAISLTEEECQALGKLAKGFNGADCVLAIKEAGRLALQSHASVLSFTSLAAGIRATKPSAIKSITVEVPKVPWAAIGGMESVKRELRDALELPSTHAHLFAQLGIPAPRGVLLFGPPGCSKTLMARAIATEGHMNFLAVKGPELLSKWLGESERALASLFRRARMASPAIIFFDEIDAIASKRGGGGDAGTTSRLLSQLLTELDGISHSPNAADQPQRVVVVGATNRPDLLDGALTRPGRIDRMIYVGMPDEDSRAQILTLTLADKSCEPDIDVAVVAAEAVTGGCSGAEVVAICRDAALLALEESDSIAADLPSIAMRHLRQAAAEMKRQITPEMLRFYETYHQRRGQSE